MILVHQMRRSAGARAAVAALLCAGVAAGCGSTQAPPPSADVWATVDGREIHRDDVEMAYRRMATAPAASADEALTARLNLLDGLITQDILVARASALKLDVTSGELDSALSDRRGGMSDDAYQKFLTERNLTAADVKDGLRLELVAQKVIDHEVVAKVNVTDQDIAAYYDANRAQFNLAEPSYHIAQIVVTPVRDPQLTNRMSDDATTPEAADRKVQMLMQRLKDGVRFSELAMDYSEDPQSAAQGGDLGFVPASALNQAPPPLRDAVLKSTPGTVSVVSSGGGHTLVLLIEKEPAGQRTLSTPGLRENIGGMLHDRKEQLLRAAYLSAARNDAKVVNYLARRIVESQGKVPPGLLPSQPGR